MGRLRLTRVFCRAVQRLGRRDRRIAAQAAAGLERDWPALPGPDDREIVIPPVRRCLGRPVPRTSLWIYYEVRGEEIWALNVAPAVE
ncbi:MAG: hypothetical protein HYY06_02470 [Deltaproteobacteria bacterium]|nr:hypothetical protein [Deltaproteobacteria bacterium]